MFPLTKSMNLAGIGDILTTTSQDTSKAKITDSVPVFVGETLMMDTAKATGNTTMDPATKILHRTKNLNLMSRSLNHPM